MVGLQVLVLAIGVRIPIPEQVKATRLRPRYKRVALVCFIYMPFTVPANFIDVFKIGDNINYNLNIQKILYEYYNKSSERYFLIKPIVIINTSISEAILYDFIENRIRRGNKTERLFESILGVLKSKKLDKFEHFIAQAKKYDFFELKDTDFYDSMNTLRKIRNRIHIQNSKWDEPKDEDKLFNEEAKILSEKVLEKILDTMKIKYPRREEYHNYVKDFELPWEKHFNT